VWRGPESRRHRSFGTESAEDLEEDEDEDDLLEDDEEEESDEDWK